MSELPPGWLETSVGEVASDVAYGFTASADWDSVGPYMLRITDIQDNKVDWLKVPHCKISDEQKAHYLLRSSDILFARTGATVGKSFRISGKIPESVFASYLIRVRCNLDDLSRYLAYFFQSPGYWEQVTASSAGTGQPNVNGTKLKELRFPLAPARQQLAIADKIDDLVAKIHACRARLDRVPQILKKFREAVLEAAVSGRLTEEWRGSTRGAQWPSVSVESLCETTFDGPFGSNLKSKDYSDSGVRVVRLENIGHLQFRGELQTFITRAKYRSLEKHALIKDDVVFSSFVDEEVRICLIPETLGPAINKADCFCLRISAEKALPQFVAYRLATADTYSDFKAMVRGVTRPRINISHLKKYEITVPPIPEQMEIVRRVDNLFDMADRLQARYVETGAQMDKLPPSVLAKAFRGGLVPQDPNDEPAGDLLERLAAMKESLSKKRKNQSPRI